MIFLDRRNREGDTFLDWKIRLFFVGAILALVGMAWDSRVLVGLAVAALILGMALRFWGRRDDFEEIPDDEAEGGVDEVENA